MREAARRGTSGVGGPLPHLEMIQRAFGSFPLGSIRAHTDPMAAHSARSMGATAFAYGEHVAFSHPPDLRTAAHEAAHVVQQRSGVQLKDGIGHAGDRYEQHADTVADLVARGQSVESMLDRHPATRGAGGARLQQQQAPALQRAPIPGWNFTPADHAKLQSGGNKLTIAADSTWFPAKLQQNLFNTLDFLLGSKAAEAPTEGVNALDTFHGHLVVKKDPATKKDAGTQVAAAATFDKDLAAARQRAIGKMSFARTGYKLTDAKIPDYQKAIDKLIPSYTKLLDDTLKIPGAAVMYHTFEFNQPSEIKARIEACRLDTIKEWQDPSILERRRHGVRPISLDLEGSFNTLCNKPIESLKASDPRRHYVTPLDTNTPRQFTPPSGATYEKEFTHVIRFAFLVDTKGAVHVRPMTTDTGFTTLELSTITGTTYPEPLEFEK